ncbi:hypothetical protein AGLY_009626, partial [Aphis glycines]
IGQNFSKSKNCRTIGTNIISVDIYLQKSVLWTFNEGKRCNIMFVSGSIDLTLRLLSQQLDNETETKYCKVPSFSAITLLSTRMSLKLIKLIDQFDLISFSITVHGNILMHLYTSIESNEDTNIKKNTKNTILIIVENYSFLFFKTSYDSQLIRKTEEGDLLLYYFPNIILDLDYRLSIQSPQNNKQNILFIALK